MSTTLRSWFVASVVLALAGCEKPRVVPVPRNLPTWTLSDTPQLRIGHAAIPGARFMSISSAARLSTGEIVVRGGYDLNVVSANGTFVKRLSGHGDGPGELTGLVTMSRAGDTLVIIQQPPGVSQAHVFTVRDGFLRRNPIHATNAPMGVIATERFAGGEYFVTAAMPRRRPTKRVEPGDMMRDSAQLGILPAPASAGSVRWLGTYQVSSLYWYPLKVRVPLDGGAEGPLRGPTFTASTYVFGTLCVRAVSGDRVWIGDSGTGAISIYDASGQRVAQLAMPVPVRPFNMDALERAKERAIAEEPHARARYEWLYAKSLLPATVPHFVRFVPGTDGEMMVERFDEDVRGPKRMLVFDRTGTPIAELVFPPDLEVHEVGRDYVLGAESDSAGAERVVVYGLKKND